MFVKGVTKMAIIFLIKISAIENRNKIGQTKIHRFVLISQTILLKFCEVQFFFIFS